MGRLESFFAKASKINKSKSRFYEPETWESMKEKDGIRRFRRKALGLFKRSAIKSSDEIASLLYETGIASSIEEGKRIVPSLTGADINYGPHSDLCFTEVKNQQGQEKYKIELILNIYVPI